MKGWGKGEGGTGMVVSRGEGGAGWRRWEGVGQSMLFCCYVQFIIIHSQRYLIIFNKDVGSCDPSFAKLLA